MRKDVINYEYFTADNCPEVTVEIRKTVFDTKDVRRTPKRLTFEMLDVVNRILKKKPHWTFKAEFESAYSIRRSDVSDYVIIHNLDVYDGDERLGYVRWGRQNGWGKEGYEFDNFRLNSARSRNRASFSTKPNVVANRVVKMFYSKTPSELAAEAAEKTSSAVSGVSSSNGWEYRRKWDHLKDELERYVIENWCTLQSQLGTVAASIDLPAIREEAAQAREMEQLYRHNAGWVVLAQPNGRYIVRVREEVETYTDSTLPDRLRMGLGLLKMVDENKMIAGVGVRAKDNTFFVCKEPTNG